MPPGIFAGYPCDSNRPFGKYCRGMKKRTVVLSTIKAMTQANPKGLTCGNKSNIAAGASAGEVIHAVKSFLVHPFPRVPRRHSRL